MENTFDPCTAIVVALEGADADQIEAIDSAVAQWNAAGGFKVSRAPVRSTADDAADAGWLPIHFQRAAGPFRGLYDDKRGMIFINDGLRGRRRAVTVAHELGHAFGLWHVDPKRRLSIMNPRNVELWPTVDDVGDVHALWGTCDASASDASVAADASVTSATNRH